MPRQTVPDLLRAKAENRKIVMVTAYDYTMARLADAAEVDMVLVGDSLGMVIQGLEDTLAVTLDEMIYHARCVSRGLKHAHLTVDMPFMSYQVSPAQALAAAGRVIKESGGQSVKFEGGERTAPAIRAVVEAGIPVVGHVGLTPQSVHAIGGFRVQGRSQDAAEAILRDAHSVEDAGAFCVVLEAIPEDVAAQVTEELDIPTIGIGAGSSVGGQVLVCNDLIGLDASFKPRFVKRYAELEGIVIEAFRSYAAEVRQGQFPTEEHSFRRNVAPARLARIY
jgi:3-methyl-2-oxobutanoate hydroxymethyltransferase